MSGQPNQGLGPRPTAHDAALRGASLAFAKPPVKPKPQVNTYTGGGNGALLAATKVGLGGNASAAGSPVHLTNQVTGGSSRSGSRPSLSPTRGGSKASSSNTLNVRDDISERVPSPSNIAARLAAARYSPRPPISTTSHTQSMMSEQTTNERDILPPAGSVGSVLARLETMEPVAQRSQKRRDSFGSQSTLPVPRTAAKHDKPTDETPIPSTSSLVKAFEQKRPTTPTDDSTVPLHSSKSSPPLVRSPKPQRAIRIPPEPQEPIQLQRTKTHTPPPVKPKPGANQRIELPPVKQLDGSKGNNYFTTPRKDPMKSPPIKQKPVRLASSGAGPSGPKGGASSSPSDTRTLPRLEGTRRSASLRRVSTSAGSENAPSSPSSFKSAKEEQDEEDKPKPMVPPPRRSNTRKPQTAPQASTPRSSAPLPVPPRSANAPSSPLRSPERLSPPRRPASTSGTSPGSVYHNAYQRDSVKQITQHMTGESLSNAMMGAALASSRNASPASAQRVGIDPLFPPRKHHHHHSPFHRSPSPPKQSPPKVTGKLRTTMRKDPSSSSSEDEGEKYKKKGTRIMGMRRKHPNKHHEGTRKRWRDQITERERKRYEGVWAANKGVFLPNSSQSPSRLPPDDDPSLDVINLVVQEIWTRSRLPTHVLEEVWDLVDNRAIGRLSREEFVVGLWLVDQRLKGRKLPVKVSDSVWTSARGLGVKVKVRG